MLSSSQAIAGKAVVTIGRIRDAANQGSYRMGPRIAAVVRLGIASRQA
jgi:hypothetical protein